MIQLKCRKNVEDNEQLSDIFDKLPGKEEVFQCYFERLNSMRH